MAGDWIKFETATLDKPEVWAIATELNIDPDAVVGKLLRVWAWFDTHSEDGNAPIVTSALLDRNCCVTGFVEAMVNCGWMVKKDGMLSLPNFERHNGQTAKSRILTAKRVAKHKSNASSVTSALPERYQSVTPSVTSALPKEEKIIEEKKEKKEGGGGEVVMVFPVKGGLEWGLTKDVANELKARFPKKDRKTEYEKAIDWLESDNKNLKTPQGMKRFLANWLERSEDKQPVERMRTSAELLEETRLAMESRQKRYDAERLAKEQAEQQFKDGG
jgi:hypothetical protein